MPVPPVQVTGLKELRAALKALGPEWPRKLAQANKRVAELLVPPSKRGVSSVHVMAKSGNPSGKVQAKLAPTIRSVQSQVAAELKVGKGPNGNYDFTFGALLGSNKRASSQFPVHLGNRWNVGDAGGPYGLGEAIHDEMPAVRDAYQTEIFELMQQAFPN